MTDKTGTKKTTTSKTPAPKKTTAAKTKPAAVTPESHAALVKRVKELEDRVENFVTRVGGAIGLSIED